MSKALSNPPASETPETEAGSRAPSCSLIPVKPEEWAHLVQCARVLRWLGKQGCCWRNANVVNSDWRVGGETEWMYGDEKKLIAEVEGHRDILEK
jgi:hypothetical protein